MELCLRGRSCGNWGPIRGPVHITSIARGTRDTCAIDLCYVQRKQRESDMLWLIDPDELRFDENPRVLGRGSFGTVWLADYRGTSVAVKRVLPQNDVRGSTSHVSMKSVMENPPESANVKRGLDSFHGLGRASHANPKPYTKRFGDINSKTYDAQKTEFVKEMRFLSKLRHTNITTIMGAVVSDKSEPMMVMEYMHLGSLHDLLHNESMVWDADVTVHILQDIAKGIRFLHSSNPIVVQGDIKAANVLIDEKLRAKVSDFGLSQKSSLKDSGCNGVCIWAFIGVTLILHRTHHALCFFTTQTPYWVVSSLISLQLDSLASS